MVNQYVDDKVYDPHWYLLDDWNETPVGSGVYRLVYVTFPLNQNLISNNINRLCGGLFD